MAAILRQISLLFTVLAGLAGLCLLLALSQQYLDVASGLAMTGLISFFIALVLVSALPPASRAPPLFAQELPRQHDGLILILIFWLTMPWLACLPFLTSHISESLAAALFEASSNLTTTGTSAGPHIQPDPIRLWRACLQWFGGTVSTATAIAIFAEYDSSSAGSIRTRAPYAVGLRVFMPSVLLCGSLYFGAAILTMLALVWKNVGVLSAFEAAMAMVTTSNSLSGIVPGPNIVPLIPMLALLIGASNIRSLAGIGHHHTKAWKRDPEIMPFIFCVLVTGILLCLWSGQWRTDILFEALSFMATSGIRLTETRADASILPLPVPELLALIGGCALSTAGGLKIIRIRAMSGKVWRDLTRLSYANTASRAGKDRNPAIAGAFIYLSAYIGAIGLLLLILSATGIDWVLACRGAIGILTNTGPLLATILHPESSDALLLIAGLGCVLGRLEILALAPLLSRDIWR